MLAVSDTGPLYYLVLIGEGDLPGHMFKRVVIPGAVRAELSHPETPSVVQQWLARSPAWLYASAVAPDAASLPSALDAGERATIALAAHLRADLVLMDDRAGVTAARSLGLAVTGTLGLLYRAAAAGHVDLHAAFNRLSKTSFHCTAALLQGLLRRFDDHERHGNTTE